jgi:hypothetical protein
MGTCPMDRQELPAPPETPLPKPSELAKRISNGEEKP